MFNEVKRYVFPFTHPQSKYSNTELLSFACGFTQEPCFSLNLPVTQRDANILCNNPCWNQCNRPESEVEIEIPDRCHDRHTAKAVLFQR